MKKPIEYKFRAECLNDVLELVKIKTFSTTLWTLNNDNPIGLDVEVTFWSDSSLTKIINEMKNVIDGHVMYQTIQPIEKYTGQRILTGIRYH